MKENIIKTKSKEFAIKIVELYKYLVEEKKEYVISKQLLRSGTSIGANVSESEYAVSTKDFINKLYIALKECNETIYWLELLNDTNYLDENYYNDIRNLCEEILKILLSSTKTLKKKIDED